MRIVVAMSLPPRIQSQRYMSAGRLEGDSELQVWMTVSESQLWDRARAFQAEGTKALR